MRAWAIQEYGGPVKLHLMDLPSPEMGSNDVLIGVKAASINPLDWKLREGMLKRIRKTEFPLILGNDCSGVVLKVGAGVRNFQEGDEVYTRVPKERIGTLAEEIAVDAGAVAHKPSTLSFSEAAGVPLVALTAWQVLHDFVELKEGGRVFIQAGAGGVGSIALQLARRTGAEVITTASAAKHDLVKELGAHRAIDYRNEQFEEKVSECDLIFDTIGGETLDRSVQCLKKGGVLVSVSGPLDPQTAENLGLNWLLRRAVRAMSWSVRRAARKKGGQYRFLFMRPDGDQLQKIGELIDAGELQVVVDKVFAFQEAPEAFAYAEKGHSTGKVVVSGA